MMYTAQDNDSPASIAVALGVDADALVARNRVRYAGQRALCARPSAARGAKTGRRHADTPVAAGLCLDSRLKANTVLLLPALPPELCNGMPHETPSDDAGSGLAMPEKRAERGGVGEPGEVLAVVVFEAHQGEKVACDMLRLAVPNIARRGQRFATIAVAALKELVAHGAFAGRAALPKRPALARCGVPVRCSLGNATLSCARRCGRIAVAAGASRVAWCSLSLCCPRVAATCLSARAYRAHHKNHSRRPLTLRPACFQPNHSERRDFHPQGNVSEQTFRLPRRGLTRELRAE